MKDKNKGKNFVKTKIDELAKSHKIPFSLRAVGVTSRRPSFHRKPESSLFNQLQSTWTPPGLDPGSTGVTTFYETIKFCKKFLD